MPFKTVHGWSFFCEGEASAGGFGVLQAALAGDPDYPKIAKKTPSIREVKEVREVRDDRPACFVILLSKKVNVGSPDVMRWSRYGYRPKKASGCCQPGADLRRSLGRPTTRMGKPTDRGKTPPHTRFTLPAHGQGVASDLWSALSLHWLCRGQGVVRLRRSRHVPRGQPASGIHKYKKQPL